jgi:hypothetical protein
MALLCIPVYNLGKSTTADDIETFCEPEHKKNCARGRVTAKIISAVGATVAGV